MNSQIIKHKINFVRETIIEAKTYLDNYKKKNEKRDLLALERLAEEIVETSIKINIELLKEKKIFPNSYKNSFLKLETLKIFKKQFLEELSETALFRNELAHEYMEMSSFYSIENIEKILKLYPQYLLKVFEFIVKSKD